MWNGERLRGVLLVRLNGEVFGKADTAVDMTFDFPTLIAHAARTRPLAAGSIIGSGTVSNRDRTAGSTCLAERRMLDSDDPLTAVAIDAGFATLQHFSAAFREATGESPSAWRAKRRR